MIINIRGTHGSGKSTIVRRMLDRYEAKPESLDKRGKAANYVMQLGDGSKLFVVGGYENACGGCDGIQPYSEIWPRVVRFAAMGHVLFEGALVSSSYGNIGRDSEQYGDQFIFAFLNTPVEVCLERIKKRRLEKGNTKELNPHNTVYKFDNIQRSIAKIRDEFGRRVEILDYRKPIPQLLGLFYASNGALSQR